jgi:deazaflavin-dependent oxidoreductase (nitroreductase family)
MRRACCAQEGGRRRSRILGENRVNTKRRVSTFLSVPVFNPLVPAAERAGLPLCGVALLETRGRQSGLPRQTPVGLSVERNTAWIVAEHGRRAAYVRNLEADPHVRVLRRRRWRAGLAFAVDDDPRERPDSATARRVGAPDGPTCSRSASTSRTKTTRRWPLEEPPSRRTDPDRRKTPAHAHPASSGKIDSSSTSARVHFVDRARCGSMRSTFRPL